MRNDIKYGMRELTTTCVETGGLMVREQMPRVKMKFDLILRVFEATLVVFTLMFDEYLWTLLQLISRKPPLVKVCFVLCVSLTFDYHLRVISCFLYLL